MNIYIHTFQRPAVLTAYSQSNHFGRKWEVDKKRELEKRKYGVEKVRQRERKGKENDV